MKNFILGFICGALIVGTAWAAQSMVLVSGDGTEVGTASNPIHVQAV